MEAPMRHAHQNLTNIKHVEHTVDEQYEFMGWLITIQNELNSEYLNGFAVPCKYAHVLNIDNYQWADDIAIENDIQYTEDGEHDYSDPDFDWIALEWDDYKTKSVSYMLQYIVETIHGYLKMPQESQSRHSKKIFVLKQIKKKASSQITDKRYRTFHHTAWATMVKLRDGKCVECGSEKSLHAHHIKPYKSHPELRYDIGNGVTLCSVCHRIHHSLEGR
jgi:hypothetical protein